MTIVNTDLNVRCIRSSCVPRFREEAKALSWSALDVPENRLFRNLKVILISGDDDTPQTTEQMRQYVQVSAVCYSISTSHHIGLN